MSQHGHYQFVACDYCSQRHSPMILCEAQAAWQRVSTGIESPAPGQLYQVSSKDSARPFPPLKSPLTGGSSDYYKLRIVKPTNPDNPPYEAECNDIIEALGMTFAEGNIFKALWRLAAQRSGNGKPGNTALYDAEKIEWFGGRVLEQEQARKAS